MKTVKYYQFYWNCNGFLEKFREDGWSQYSSQYQPIVFQARKWCEDQNFTISYCDGWPFVITFWKKEELMIFKLRWGTGEVLECYEEGGFTRL